MMSQCVIEEKSNETFAGRAELESLVAKIKRANKKPEVEKDRRAEQCMKWLDQVLQPAVFRLLDAQRKLNIVKARREQQRG